ncbi:hypothetical protein G7Y89_g13109 [Cudoniella acicularis]|uniref:Rhodopsin domain-containing protein n=1 Tax=Cudoniella acicularis TaxID=354080 RepID=A0A8H4RA85_9HELO|nr:hypothetical protein G7Y89_g13109 [Cudoniella acicularis]
MSLPPGIDLSKVPLMPNPSGAPPNFVDPPSLASTVEGVGISLMIISGFLLIFRLVANLKNPRRLGFDDLSEKGTSRHAWDVPFSVITVSYIQIAAATQIVIAPTWWAAKSAILALYIRVFGTVRWLRFMCYFWITFMALFYGSNIAIAIVYCIPREGEAWDGTSFQRCSTSAWAAVVIGVFSVLTDIIIFVLPFPIILKLRLPSTKKIGLTIVFFTGFLLIVMSSISLILRVKIYRGNDPTWNGTRLGIITAAEIFGIAMVSCAPALSAFWFTILTKSSLWSSFQSSFLFSSKKSQPSEASLRMNAQNQYYSTSNLKEPGYKVLDDEVSTNFAGQRNDVYISAPGSIPLKPLNSMRARPN